jgi:hypothetical protein
LAAWAIGRKEMEAATATREEKSISTVVDREKG